MRAFLLAKLWEMPRCPLAGVALAAVAGVMAAESGRRWAAVSPWVAGGVFMLFALAWGWQRHAAWLWGAVVAGYAALHLFAAEPVPAVTLARVLASPVGGIATGNDPGHATAHVIHAVGTVADLPRLVPPPTELAVPSAGPSWRFNVRLEEIEVDGLRWPCHAAVTVQWRDAVDMLSPGDRLDLTGLAENVAPPRNPGQFDLAAHLRRQGIFSAVRVAGIADGRVLPGGRSWLTLAPWRRVAGGFHDWMARTLRLDLNDDPEAAAIVSTTLLGLSDQPGLGDLENVFQRTGTLHYFAVDGLKLGLVAFLLLRVLASLGFPRPWPGLLVLPLLAGYAFATGLGVASLRAVLVAFVVVGAEWADRPVRSLNSLGAAAAAVLLWNPPGLFDLGFQLTFTVMLAILLLVPPLGRWLQQFGAPDAFLPRVLYSRWLRAREGLRHHVCALTAVSVAAWVGSLPIMLGTFHLFSPVSLVANVVTFPLAFAVLGLGVCSLMAGGISTTLAVWFNNANWLCAKGFLWMARAFDALPGGSFAVASPGNWHWPAPAAELVVYDFDRGRAASLRAGSSEWLIDTARLSEYATGVLPCLRSRAVERLDGGLLLTQADADHLAAARLAVGDLHPARIVESARANRSPLLRDFRRFLGEQKREETFCRFGDRLSLGRDTHATVLYPPDDLSGKFRAAADRALALRIETAGWRVVMLTEGSGAAAQWLAAHGAKAEVAGDVLVTSAPVWPGLVEAVRPRLVMLRPPIVKENARIKAGAAMPGEVSVIPAEVPVLVQRDCGAVTLLIYPRRLQASGFVDGRRVTLEK